MPPTTLNSEEPEFFRTVCAISRSRKTDEKLIEGRFKLLFLSVLIISFWHL